MAEPTSTYRSPSDLSFEKRRSARGKNTGKEGLLWRVPQRGRIRIFGQHTWSNKKASIEDDSSTIPLLDFLSSSTIRMIWMNVSSGYARNRHWKPKTPSSLSLRFIKATGIEKPRWSIPGGFREIKNRREIAEKRIREEAMELPTIDFFDSL